jgi:hypothetical protein
MHTRGMAGGEQTAGQPKTPTETAPPPGGSARARAQQDNRDHQARPRDGCSRRVAGRAIDERMRGDLVESALAMVVAMRGELAKTVIVDPDRGCTPAHSWRGSPARHDLTRSVGRIGVCWATLPPNHSGATLIVALYDRYLWPTRTAPKLAVGDWIGESTTGAGAQPSA